MPEGQELCPYCHKNPVRKGRTYCSKQCAGRARQHYRTCAVCGRPFACPPSADTRTCSRACSAELRRRNALHLSQWPKLKAGGEVYRRITPAEQWPQAKGWTLRAPDGAIYECQNLLAFFRGHPELIETSPETAARGIVAIKCTLTGSRKRNKTTQWRGWTLLDWDDRPMAAAPAPMPSE